jgi:hypothetical protein
MTRHPTGNAPGLDWRDRAHWGGGRLLPCRHCHRPAFCRDDTGRPAHKVCAELALTSTEPNTTTTRMELSA